MGLLTAVVPGVGCGLVVRVPVGVDAPSVAGISVLSVVAAAVDSAVAAKTVSLVGAWLVVGFTVGSVVAIAACLVASAGS